MTTPDATGLQLQDPDYWQKVHVLMSVMAVRPLNDAERNELHECHVAIRSNSTLPSDWVAVPREPTEEMCNAMRISVGDGIAMKPVYAAMLAAAPSAPAEGGDYSACCDTPTYCSSVRRCTAKDAPEPLAQGQALGYTAIFNAIAAATWPATEGVSINVSVAKFHESIGGNVYASPQPAAEDLTDELSRLRRVEDKYRAILDSASAPNPPQPSASVGERARELANEWRHALTNGNDGHELCANWNTIAQFVNAIDALTTAAGGGE